MNYVSKSKEFIFYTLVLAFMCQSCTKVIQRRLYAPLLANNPAVKEKKDYSVTLAVSTPAGIDLNGGYALTNHIALIGGVYSYSNKEKEEATSFFGGTENRADLSYNNKGFHLGGGFFLPLNKKAHTYLSFFAGWAKGSFKMNETFYASDTVPPKYNFYRSQITRWFYQGSVNHYTPFHYQSFFLRIVYAGYKDVATDYTANEQWSYKLPPTGYPKWSSFFEFGYEAKFFLKKNPAIGLQLSGIVSTRLNNEDFDFYNYPFRWSAGIVIVAPPKKSKL